MQLVIVESPTKCKTIQKFLGKEYQVSSSMGHIRDLPSKELGVDVKKDFKPKYVIPDKAKKQVQELKKLAKEAGSIILATDEDREGESIAWHLAYILGLKDPDRIAFHEITKPAIEEALKHPRKIDQRLVDAQQARRILDRLVGYKLSPFLWKKVMRGLSAGRVQSVAVRLVCEREAEIKMFKPDEYWTIVASLLKLKIENEELKNNGFQAILIKEDGKTIEKLAIKNKKEADKILKDLKDAEYKVADIEKKETKRNPFPPFTTSTLQQTSSSKFGYGAKQTMMIAQKLYEKGLCVDENSLVIAKNGEIYKIKQMEKTDKIELSSIDERYLKTKFTNITKFWKIKAPKQMLSIETSSHKNILITPDHPLMVIRNGQPTWTIGKDIKISDYLGVMEKIEVQRQKKASTIFEIIEKMPLNDQKNIYLKLSDDCLFTSKLSSHKTKRNIMHYPQIKRLIESKIISYDFVKKHYRGIAASNAPAAKFQKISLNFSSELAYVFGFITGDGHLEKNRPSLSFSCKNDSAVALQNMNKMIHKALGETFNKLNTKKVSYRFNSTFLHLLFQHLGTPIGKKSNKIDISNILLRQPDEILKNYIAGLWDSDGCITKSWKNSIRISYSSKSEIFIDKLRLLLKTFEINSAKHFDKRNKVHWLLLTARAIPKFRDHIAPYLIIKKDYWGKIYNSYQKLYEKRIISRCQAIPTIAPLVQKLLIQNNLPKQKMSKLIGVDLFNYFGKIKKQHNRLPFIPKSILLEISKFIDTNDGLLYRLSKSPIAWEKIKTIKSIPYTKNYVYDVTTSTHTFIVNGIVSHNCTYHRTDSLNLSSESLGKAKTFIENTYGKQYFQSRGFKTKSKSAQEAHEAIRPAYPEKTPDSLKLMPHEFKLYGLIWSRFISSQMTPAVFDSVAADISANKYTFRATGQTLKFDGFLKVYKIKFEELTLPPIKENEILTLKELKPEQHFTQPPARYSEATLIKALEKADIGRPSTYAPIMSTIQQRNYVEKNEQKKFQPTKIGSIVNGLLVEHFPKIVDIDFTAKMETELDEIAEGKDTYEKTLTDFYTPFEDNLKKKEKQVEKLDLTEKTDKICPKCGSAMVLRLGRFGKFLACSKFPNCKHTENLPKPSLGMKCPKCQKGEIVERRTKKKKVFYGCSEYPKCDFALWDKPLAGKEKWSIEKCPKCGEPMVITKSKQIHPVKSSEAGISPEAKLFNRVKCSNKECLQKNNPTA